ncbi:MAG: four helix bundle protein [Alistipes sp.]|nr:four helix bundle protein [Alistipes sp.]
MKNENLILEKSFLFAKRIVLLYQELIAHSDNRVLATQLLKCGTSIGANVREAVRAQSRNEFLAKMNISLKEAYECEYWLELLHATCYLKQTSFDSLFSECRDLTNIIAKIVISTKENNEKHSTTPAE